MRELKVKNARVMSTHFVAVFKTVTTVFIVRIIYVLNVLVLLLSYEYFFVWICMM